ncbi:hypothetical protein HYT45_00085 [Candidatus Uhrbacteria bacterium]|nr:hypothetical protein [Candidatus Uhrbacteria bacterium]
MEKFQELKVLKYYFILSKDLNLLKIEKADKMIESAREVGAMLNALTKAIKYTLKPKTALQLTK